MRDINSLIKSSFGISINASDFFDYACADMVIIDPLDLKWVMPIYEKYGDEGIYACISFIAKRKPIKEHDTHIFNKIYKEIEDINPETYSEY